MLYTGAVVVTNRSGVKTDKVAGRKESMWERRLQKKIKELRKDLSQLEASKDKDFSNVECFYGRIETGLLLLQQTLEGIRDW